MTRINSTVKVDLIRNGALITVGEDRVEDHIIVSDEEVLLIADKIQAMRPEIEERIKNREKIS